jgi:hypothetical protein
MAGKESHILDLSADIAPGAGWQADSTGLGPSTEWVVLAGHTADKTLS